jgi:hypothetical protein
MISCVAYFVYGRLIWEFLISRFNVGDGVSRVNNFDDQTGGGKDFQGLVKIKRGD